MTELEKVKLEFQQESKNISNNYDLDQLKSKFLGKKSFVASLVEKLKATSAEEKKELGKHINSIRTFIEDGLKECAEKLSKNSAERDEKFYDFSMSVKDNSPRGRFHIYTKVADEIKEILQALGFSYATGPEAEHEFYNFTALNIPEDHPAKDMYDTLWLNVPSMLLRTHTSSVQIHQLAKKKFPIANFSIGRVFRHESTDATHDVSFTQCEGIFVDKEASLANLLGVMQALLQKFFQSKTIKMRIRPGFFPFVEPGIEVDMSCIFCKTGCSICKKSTWIEVFPGGLIHPNVLKAVKIDPTKYMGFAWGFGVERMAMLKYGIDDVRLFKSGDLRFLSQF